MLKKTMIFPCHLNGGKRLDSGLLKRQPAMSGTKLRKLLQEKMEQANSRRKVTAEDTKRLAKLEVIVDKLKRRENVQNF
jgi:hypothetical protein